MKPKSFKTILALALLAPGALFAQTTATTTPVGYISLGNTTAATDNLPASTDIFISAPLNRPSEYQGTVASITGAGSDTLTFAGTPFTASQWVAGATEDPYIIVVESGTKAGLQALVLSNSTNEITVVIPNGETLAGIDTNKISVRRANTPSSLFPGTALPVGCSILFFDDAGQNLSSSNSYLYLGGDAWEDQADLGDAAHKALFATEGFVLRNDTATPVADLVISGEAPVQNSRATFAVSTAAGQDVIVSFFGGADEQVATSGLDSVMTSGDSLLIFDNEAAGKDKSSSNSLLYLGGGAFEDQSDLGDGGLFNLKPGVAYVIRKQAGSTIGTYTWSNLADYVPGL